MSFKKNINDIKKKYSLGIIGGGQLALMLTEAAKKRNLENVTNSIQPQLNFFLDQLIKARRIL